MARQLEPALDLPQEPRDVSGLPLDRWRNQGSAHKEQQTGGRRAPSPGPGNMAPPAPARPLLALLTEAGLAWVWKERSSLRWRAGPARSHMGRGKVGLKLQLRVRRCPSTPCLAFVSAAGTRQGDPNPSPTNAPALCGGLGEVVSRPAHTRAGHSGGQWQAVVSTIAVKRRKPAHLIEGIREALGRRCCYTGH